MAFPLVVLEKEVADRKAERRCGDCAACCVTFPMPFLGKKAWQPCKHLCHYGCGEYLTRPKQCKEFQCLWLQGHLDGDERRRPDNLGLVIYNTNSPLGTHLAVMELWEKALDAPEARYVIDRLAKKVFVYVYRYQYSSHEMFGPPRLVAAARARLDELQMAKLAGLPTA